MIYRRVRLSVFYNQCLNFSYKVIYSFFKGEGLNRASSLAYAALISFVPFFISVLSIISLFPIPNKAKTQVEKFILENFLPATGEIIFKYMEIFRSHAKTLSVFSFLLLFLTAVSMINTLSNHIDKLWKIQRPKISFSFAILIDFSLMIIGPLLLSLSLILAPYIAFIKYKNTSLLHFLPFIISVLAFALIYKVVPRTVVKTQHAFIAGLSGAVLFEIAKLAFIIYVKKFATENLLYGSLAIIPLFLLWLYISSAILLLCGQIIYALNNPQLDLP
ncbi:MAG: YhjD/YihY/BrkB family envelope integrity protein [Burkholderiales bacterium]